MVTFKEFFSFKNNRFFWLNLIAMVVVIVAAAWGTLQWLDSYTRHGEAVVVPDVKGMNLRIAENELDKQSLKSIVIDSSYVKGIAPGAILEQNPAGGSKVKSGRTVYLTVNADTLRGFKRGLFRVFVIFGVQNGVVFGKLCAFCRNPRIVAAAFFGHAFPVFARLLLFCLRLRADNAVGGIVFVDHAAYRRIATPRTSPSARS